MTMKTPANKRILFLSIDCVIDTLRARISGFTGDPVGIAAINQYINQINTRVVIVCAEHIYSKYEGGIPARLERFNIIGATLHQDYNAFLSGETYLEGITAWVQRNGLEEDTEHLVICPETVNIEGLIAIKTDRDGLSSGDLAYLDYLRGETRLNDVKNVWNYPKSTQRFPGE